MHSSASPLAIALGVNVALVRSPSRVALIRQRWAARFGTQAEEIQVNPVEVTTDEESGEVVTEEKGIGAAGVLSVSPREVAEVARSVVSIANDDAEIVDEEKAGVTPSIRPEVASVEADTEKTVLLSREEKRALARDLQRYREEKAKKELALRLPFAIVLA